MSWESRIDRLVPPLELAGDGVLGDVNSVLDADVSEVLRDDEELSDFTLELVLGFLFAFLPCSGICYLLKNLFHEFRTEGREDGRQ